MIKDDPGLYQEGDRHEKSAENLADFHEHLLDHMIDVITIIDETGLIAYQSTSIHRMLGYDPETMLGQSVSSYIHPDDRNAVDLAMAKLLANELDTNQEQFRFRHENGEYRQIHAVAQRWDRNGIRGIMVNSRDVTEAYNAQLVLAEQNELLAKTFAVSSNLLSISLPRSGKLLKVSDAWCDVLGYRREEVLGKTALELGIWGAGDSRQRLIDEFERHGQLQGFESAVYTKSGEERFMLMDAQLLIVADQPQILLSCTDVTDSRRIEAELRQSQKMDAIGQLTGGVAHDFNNVIGVTMGNAELLLDLVADRPKALAHARQIFSAAEQGANLTHQLLAFSRRQTLAPEPVDLSAFLGSVRPILQTTVSENTLIEVSAAANLWACQVDPNQLHTALLNLTLNAHDAMPIGGSLSFEMCNFSALGDEKSVIGHDLVGDLSKGDYVALRITDSGTGMDEDTLSKACEPFFSTKEIGRGTGLGLSMVFGFVKQSGGGLCLTSEPGNGTAVVLLLPKAQMAEKSALRNFDASPNLNRLAAAGSRTLLVVEDNHALRSVLVQALVDMGYKVLEAEGEEDLQQVLATNSEIDLLLTDVILRESKRGPDIAREVLAKFPDAEVLLMTGFSPEDVGLDHEYTVLAKPFTLDELSKQLHAALAATSTP